MDDCVVSFTSGKHSLRSTEYDAMFIGLWLHESHGRHIYEGGFDGIYTYFASEGFSYGSTTANWKSMCEYCDEVCM